MEDYISPICENTSKTGQEYDFSTLPPHVLASILSHLEFNDFMNALQTCKSWYYASCDPRLSAKLYLRFKPQGPSGDMHMFVSPVTRFRFKEIDLAKFDYKMLLNNLGYRITKLHINNYDRERITELSEIFIYLTNLKILKLSYGYHDKIPINFHKHGRIAKYKARIKENLSRVQELHIQAIEIDMKGAETLLRYCTNLKMLYWNWNAFRLKNVPDKFLHDVLFDRSKNCISACLENLLVHTLDRDQNSKFFEHLTSLKLPKLRSLDIKCIDDSYYDVLFQKFCEAYKLLENLTLSACNDHLLADICKFMCNLKTLHLDSVTATYLRPIGYLKNLERLTLHYKIRPTDDWMIELFCTKLENLTHLKIFALPISHVMVNELCINLPQLEQLWLGKIDTHDCEPIYRHMMKLKSLYLEFTEHNVVDLDYIESHPEWNVLKLIELEEVNVSTFVPGLTPKLVLGLPKLKWYNGGFEEYDNLYLDRNADNIIERENHDDEDSDEESNYDGNALDNDEQVDHEDNDDEEKQDGENKLNDQDDQEIDED